MQGITRAVARLLVMGSVMAGVLVAAIFTGVATTTAIAVGIVLAGIVGLFMVARRSPRTEAVDEIAAMMAPPGDSQPGALTPTLATAVEAMAPPSSSPLDPEANMPRWRRPSLLEARRSDPTRQAPSYRLPMRFTDAQAGNSDVRVVRYAVVPVLDQPDEILGLRLSALENGDEVQVLGAHGAFLEVFCPDGERGWIHRTTVAQRTAALPAPTPGLTAAEREDALSALLSARGLT
jgi:hypothetical protein